MLPLNQKPYGYGGIQVQCGNNFVMKNGQSGAIKEQDLFYVSTSSHSTRCGMCNNGLYMYLGVMITIKNRSRVYWHRILISLVKL